MKRILFYCNSLEGGGAEKVCQMLSNRFAQDNDYQVNLVLIYKKGVYLNGLSKNIKLLSSDSALKRYTIYNLFFFAKSVWLYKPDCVISFAEWPNFYAGLANYFFWNKVKIVLSEQNTKTFINDYKIYGVSKLINKVSILSYRNADKIVCCSRKVMEKVNEVLPNQSKKVIYNPVDCQLASYKSKESLEQNLNDKKLNLLAIGRLHPQKDYKTMLKAFDLAYEQNENIELYILGEGEQRAEIENLIGKLKSKNSIYLLGFKENPFSYLAKCDALLHSALYEGFGNIFIEALSVGTPIITTDCDTPREIINDPQQGTIVPVSDYQALAAAILNQPKKNGLIISSCVERAQYFDIENCYLEYKILVN